MAMCVYVESMSIFVIPLNISLITNKYHMYTSKNTKINHIFCCSTVVMHLLQFNCNGPEELVNMQQMQI